MPEAPALAVDLRQDGPIRLDVRFTCGAGDVLAIFGPSGSGKTTVLRSIAGLYRPASARVVCGAETWADTAAGLHVAARRRRVGFVFQDHALFPHMTARQNVMAALGSRPRRERRAAADRWLAAVHLAGLEARRPAALSGGQRQRVALARALARDPHVLLLDEPFAAVDRAVRDSLHGELDAVRRRVRIPVILVTHDFQDVVRLATHALVLEQGRTAAAGPIEALTSRADLPWTRYALGPGSVFGARIRARDAARGLADLEFAGGRLLVPDRSAPVGADLRVRVPAREVILAVSRPEGLSLHNILEGCVAEIAGEGDEPLVRVAVGPVHLLAAVTRDAVNRLALVRGARVYALIKSLSVETWTTKTRGENHEGTKGGQVDHEDTKAIQG